MRADRLVATLLFLQSRGRVTAAEVAAELEVSTRTARRDLEALSIAGIPVYSQPGRSGGWSLVGGARTDLTGLTAAEARTLFLIAGPSSAVTPEAKAAIRKLIQALPETFRAEAGQAAAAIVLDPSGWGGDSPQAPPHLEALQHAIVTGVQVELGYRDREGNVSERTVHPLGLVSKGTTWYLVAGTEHGQRTFRVWRIQSAQVTDLPSTRPAGFDLSTEWKKIASDITELRGEQIVTVLADRPAVGWLQAHFGSNRVSVHEHRKEIDEAGETSDGRRVDSEAGRCRIEITFPMTHTPVAELASFTPHVEVLAPASLREELHSMGEQLVASYGGAIEQDDS